jgi:hypothetical protein
MTDPLGEMTYRGMFAYFTDFSIFPLRITGYISSARRPVKDMTMTVMLVCYL